MRWYWNLSNGIKSEDCICFLAVEIRSKQRKSTKFVTFLMQLRKQEVHFQYHLNFQDDTDNWVAIELCLRGSNQKTVAAGWQLDFDLIDINRWNLSHTWMQLRKQEVYFQYHLNFQDDTDKLGAIELCLTGSNRKTVSAGWDLKFDQIDFIGRNLALTRMQLRKKKV